MNKLFLQLRSESDDGMMSDQGSGFSLSVDQDDYHFRPSNVFIPAIPGQSSQLNSIRDEHKTQNSCTLEGLPVVKQGVSVQT